MIKQDFLQLITKRLSSLEKNGGSTNNCIYEGSTWIDFNKDLVVNGFLVASKCEPNKLLFTNEHKQIVSNDISKLITGTTGQINITNQPDGTINISSAQQLDVDSTPTFGSIKIQNEPIDDNDVVTKKYVDELVADIATKNNDTQFIAQLHNPILKTDLTNNCNIKINFDEDGTINLKNDKTTKNGNEIDIFGERINLLSNINASDPNSGSLVLYGGMGILRDIHVGGGIFFKTDMGVPSKLDFFEEGSLSINWKGIWRYAIETTYVYQRIGNWVMLMLPYTTGNSITNGIIENTEDTYLPERLRPIYDIKINIDGIENDNEINTKASIYGESGKITIVPKPNKCFGGKGNCGFNTFTISYMVDVKK